MTKTLKETAGVDVFAESVRAELIFARSKYRPMASAHEGWAIIREEIDELWDEVKKKPSERDTIAMYEELVQIAAMAQRMAEDICEAGKAVEL
jgi:glutamyl-tRNA reductase